MRINITKKKNIAPKRIKNLPNLWIVPIQKQQRKGHDKKEEQRPNS